MKQFLLLINVALVMVASIFVSACTPRASESIASQKNAVQHDFGFYTAPPIHGRVFRLIPASSSVDVVVRRSGRLQRFGHDHVIGINALDGFIYLADKAEQSRADIAVDLLQLTIDDLEARQYYQLDTQPDETDIEGTRNNINKKVLYIEQWPEASLQIRTDHAKDDAFGLTVRLILMGVEKSFPLSLELVREKNSVRASGSFTIRQTDWNIEPFSVMGGALQVADLLEIHFEILASSLKKTRVYPVI